MIETESGLYSRSYQIEKPEEEVKQNFGSRQTIAFGVISMIMYKDRDGRKYWRLLKTECLLVYMWSF